MAPCGFVSFNDEGIILVVNDFLADVLQYRKEELLGKNIESIFTIPTRIFFQTHLFPLTRIQKTADEIFLSLLTSSGAQLPVLLNARRTEWDGKIINCFAFLVVHNRNKFEDELVAARNQAQKALQENSELVEARAAAQKHAEQLEEQMQLVSRQNHELQQFSHVVSHSLQEPLRKILLYSDKIQLQQQIPSVAKLLKATEQMKSVVNGLQEYVWVNEKPNRFTEVNLNQVVREVSDRLASEKGAGSFELHYENLATIQGDNEQLQLMLYHLLLNAIQFKKDEKAQISVSTVILKKNHFQALIHKYSYEDFVRLEVTDRGQGFDPVYREQVFELFRKLHQTKGPGMGLALCKKIAVNHSGSIEADSRLNDFTRITVWLPVKQTQPAWDEGTSTGK
ncbi:MAG: sensor histidine kinase [Flavisolibacter sp.]